MAKVLMVIAPRAFRDEELFETRNELQKCGHEITLASTQTAPCNGMMGGVAKPDILLERANSADYDAVVFVGGSGTPVLYENKDAHRIATEMHTEGKLVSAICLAPVILAKAGMLENRKATVFYSAQHLIKEHGAEYTAEPVTVDGRIVTGNGPAAATTFGQALCEQLAK
ncbi:MAG TPA: DJ-1/PfpI family protein [Bellilinea sp.]|nr:DJ-1/PfpI family protein [Bellilinea sp.]